MKLVILCGGSGTRLQDYSFPKPLNMIHGKPSISYCLQHVPDDITDLYFIVAPHLYEYHIEEIITNQFKSKTCHFLRLPYFTRGPIESALLGTESFLGEESVVFLDNDVLYQFPPDFFKEYTSAFLGYSQDHTGSEAYSFVTLNESRITMIQEKKRISNEFCCGVYGFSSIHQFRSLSEPFIQSVTSELYMSLLYQELLRRKEPIQGIFFPERIIHIGSLPELQKFWELIPKPPMRICFDLDHTLVTYPSTPSDYRTVKPIRPMIELAQRMKKEGHTIIIHTARRMATYHSNVGAVIKDIARITLDTLDKFEIPYDELLFGKPIADMYIDDRAVNPYRNDLQCMGYLHKEIERPMNPLPTNKYNEIVLDNNNIIKSGPTPLLEGEAYYYSNLPSANFFPLLHTITHRKGKTEICMEYIKSIPFSLLYQSEVLSETHLDLLFEAMRMLHYTPTHASPLPSRQEIIDNYRKKLEIRFQICEDYPFENASHYQTRCLQALQTYLDKEITILPYIHGDLWFSNILVTYQQQIKLIDMKGKVHTTLTTGGDPMYDYAKLYQSVLGYDLVLYDKKVSDEYATRIQSYVHQFFEKLGVSVEDVRNVAFSLMMGTMHAISEIPTKMRIWNWLVTLMDTHLDK